MNKNIMQLAELASKHPDREIIAMVDFEVVGSDDYSRWKGKIGDARLDEIYYEDERIYFKSRDLDEIKEDYVDRIYFDYEEGQITDEELDVLGDEYLDAIEWEKVIVINIDTY